MPIRVVPRTSCVPNFRLGCKKFFYLQNRAIKGGLSLQAKVQEIRKKALQAFSQAITVQQLQEARVRFLGKKGELTLLLRGMGQLPAAERPVLGRLVNEVRDNLETEFTAQDGTLALQE